MPRWMRFALLAASAAGALNVSAWAQAQSEPPRIGVFDPEVLWKQTDLGKKYNTDLTEARNRLQSEIDKKSQQLDELSDKLRQQQASLSDEKIQQMQKEILAKRTELERMNEDATKEMKF